MGQKITLGGRSPHPRTTLQLALDHLAATAAHLNHAALNLEAATRSLRWQIEAIEEALTNTRTPP